jgi:hypothetical protein
MADKASLIAIQILIIKSCKNNLRHYHRNDLYLSHGKPMDIKTKESDTIRCRLMKSEVSSNVLFILPLALSLYHHLFAHSIVLSGVIIFSFIYHLTEKKSCRYRDKFFAYLIICYNLYLIYVSDFKAPYFPLALLFVCIGLYFLYPKDRDDREWHGSASLITLCCILAYVM